MHAFNFFFSPFFFCSGNSHDDMLLAKLESVYTGSGDRGSSMVSLPQCAYGDILLSVYM